jgi:hypothetical protein
MGGYRFPGLGKRYPPMINIVECGGYSGGGRGGVSDDSEIDGPIPAEGTGVDIDLSHACVR